jgi:3-oxoacyl-[acyl-carrier protein] reductase
MKTFQPTIAILAGSAFAILQAESFAFQPMQIRTTSTASLKMASAPSGDDNSKVCLITGASRGIGKCIAKELSNKDPKTKICINYLDGMEEEAEATVKEIEDAGGEAMAIKADCKFSFC